MRIINKIIVHCSDSDVATHDNIKTVDHWHREKGWSGVGYHYFIRKSGLIEYGRTLQERGAHCRGHNADSVGICLSGQLEFTFKQYLSLCKLIEALQVTLGKLDVYPHNHFNRSKSCPNFDLTDIGIK